MNDDAILCNQLTLRHYMDSDGGEWVTASSHDNTVSVVTMLGILELGKALLLASDDYADDDE